MKIFQTVKVILLATVLSFGLSYVYAWTAPTATPPSGNVSAPLNTSATAQTKAGALTVAGLNAGSGAISTTGSVTGWDIVANSITAGSITTTGNATVNDMYISSIGKYASELYPISLFGGQHTITQCSSLGGIVADDGIGNKLCKITGTSCPSGWTKYSNWSTTQNVSGSYWSSSPTCGYKTCNSGSHAWSNTGTESLTCTGVGIKGCSGFPAVVTVTATLMEIGCY
ncbi:MAG: hypothetical protein Q7K40_03675 [bacterium]|nr:hypothetical protein [bacterium]